MKDIHDIRPPLQVGFDPMIFKFVIMIFVAVFVLALLFFLIRKYLKKRKQSENLKCLPSPVTPYEAALNALDLVSQRPMDEPRIFYFDLTAILKKYIGSTFHINSVEMTTQEFIRSLAGLDLDKTIKKDISIFCETSDPIKYAGIVPEKHRAEQAVLLIRKKIKEIEKARVNLLAQKEEDH